MLHVSPSRTSRSLVTATAVGCLFTLGAVVPTPGAERAIRVTFGARELPVGGEDAPGWECAAQGNRVCGVRLPDGSLLAVRYDGAGRVTARARAATHAGLRTSTIEGPDVSVPAPPSSGPELIRGS